MAALPSFRAEFTDPLPSTGVDFIGPLYHKTQGTNPGKETTLDVECFANNRPLCDVGEEFEQQTVTPSIRIRGKPATFLEEDFGILDDTSDITRRLRYLKSRQLQLGK